MKSCALSLDACVPLKRTTFSFSYASRQLRFHFQEATFFIAYRGFLDTDYILHSQLNESLNESTERLKSRCLFVPAAWKLLVYLRWASRRPNGRTQNVLYSTSTSEIHAFMPRVSTTLMDMGLPKVLGSNFVLALEAFVHQCVNGVSLHYRFVSVLPLNRPMTNQLHRSHASETPGNIWSNDLG